MLAKYLVGNCQFVDSVSSWQEAIDLAAQPLLKTQTIENRYIQAMIESVEVNGAYMVLLPEIAMPHARPELGSLKNGLSFLKLEEAVYFPKEIPVKIFFVLAAETSEGHLDMIASLAELFSNEELTEQLKTIKNEADLLSLIN
ncbi:PTS sugar transporter subunit IIA [Enterococcus sp. AZ103]|uniref:PTS sugar transporter subunit IIA n=1 Tax=Enterococcus sp. AZ103 TaxID=2774628 RepID=UPI003F220E06